METVSEEIQGGTIERASAGNWTNRHSVLVGGCGFAAQDKGRENSAPLS